MAASPLQRLFGAHELPPSGLRSSGLHRASLRLVIVNLAFTIVEYASWFAVLVIAFRRGGATESGFVAAAQLLPAATLAPLLARLADRVRVGIVLAGALCVAGVACSTIAALVFFEATTPLVYLAAIVLTIALAVIRPAENAAAAELAESPLELAALNTLLGFTESAGMLLGPVAVGVAAASGSLVPLFVACAGLSVGAAAMIVRLAPTRPAPAAGGLAAPPPPARWSLRSSTSLVVGFLGLRGMIIGVVDLLLLAVAIDVLGLSGGSQTTLNLMFGVGLVLGSVLQLWIVRRLAHHAVMALSAVVFSLPVAMLALGPAYALALALTTVGGIGAMTGQLSGRTLLQQVAPRGTTSRAFGFVESGELLGSAIGAALVATLIAMAGLTATLVGTALILPGAHLLLNRQLGISERRTSVSSLTPREPVGAG